MKSGCLGIEHVEICSDVEAHRQHFLDTCQVRCPCDLVGIDDDIVDYGVIKHWFIERMTCPVELKYWIQGFFPLTVEAYPHIHHVFLWFHRFTESLSEAYAPTTCHCIIWGFDQGAGAGCIAQCVLFLPYPQRIPIQWILSDCPGHYYSG